MLWVWIMFSSLDLVRRNINRAISDNMVRPVTFWDGSDTYTDRDSSMN